MYHVLLLYRAEQLTAILWTAHSSPFVSDIYHTTCTMQGNKVLRNLGTLLWLEFLDHENSKSGVIRLRSPIVNAYFNHNSICIEGYVSSYL